MRGSEVARGEILGRIGMIPINQEKKLTQRGFKVDHTSSEEFMRRINEVLETTEDTRISIPCTNEEFEQFSFPKK